MATITTANNNSALNSSRRSYVAVMAFNDDFFKYTVAMNSSYVNVGTLDVVTSDDTLTPKGRVLRENGRKLYPDANPGVTRYLVGVYDSETYLSGFIDPNSPTFTIFNSDRPNYIPVDDTVDIGAPVYTAGTIEADGTTTLNDVVTVNANLNVDAGSFLQIVITAAAYAHGSGDSYGTYTYTATNTLVPGQSVAITNITSGTTANFYNISGVVFSATTSQFVIHGVVNAATPGSLTYTNSTATIIAGLVLASGSLYVPVNKVAGVVTYNQTGANPQSRLNS